MNSSNNNYEEWNFNGTLLTSSGSSDRPLVVCDVQSTAVATCRKRRRRRRLGWFKRRIGFFWFYHMIWKNITQKRTGFRHEGSFESASRFESVCTPVSVFLKVRGGWNVDLHCSVSAPILIFFLTFFFNK